MSRPVVSFAAVALLLAGGLAGADAARGDSGAREAPPARARTTALAAAALTCPDPTTTGATSSLVAAVAPATRRTPARGQLFLRELLGRDRLQGDALPAGGHAEVVRSRGELLQALVPARTGPVLARATGALAPGVAAAQFTRAPVGDTTGAPATAQARGIGLADCAAATTDAWFVGGGAGLGRTTTLYLSDPDPAAALVDVLAWGPDGPIESRALRDLVVGASNQRMVRLDVDLPADVYGLHVVARQGRVAAALRTSESQGLQQLGWDWVAPSEAPSTRQVVPGVLGGSGTRTLRILAPGATGAVVRVSVLGVDATLHPDQVSAVAVDAGTVASVDVSELAKRAPSGLLLESDVPVTATVLERQGAAVGSGTAPAELASLSASEPVRAGESAVLPYVATGVGRFAELSLTAAERAGTVRLLPLSRPGRAVAGAAATVHIAAGRTVQVELDTAVGVYAHAVLVEVQKGSGPVWSAGTLREAGSDGPLLTALSLHPQPEVVRVPAAVPDPRLGSGS